MKVNHAKTKLLCVSDAISFIPEAEVEDVGGDVMRTASPDTMKMLGFHFTNKPTVNGHLEVLKRRFRSRYWILIHLRNAGFNTEELVRVYKVILRPVHDYLCVVYHAMMSDRQDEEVERLQAHALKYIFGWKIPYARMRDMAGLGTLRDRRI